MDIVTALYSNYLPYAKSVIIDRSVVRIDGLKPSQRRIMYSMWEAGLVDSDADKVKSTKVVGDTMNKYHPHGDSIYETMVYMSDNHGGLNVPYINAKGNFGDVRSPEDGFAKPRYTEVKLHESAKYMFDGIKENAVDMVDNFDNTLKEPVVLPVKYPNILVNSNAGIAVALSANIPSYALRNVCAATIGVMDGTIKTDKELSEVLGAPEFPTGGIVRVNDKMLEDLCRTGSGTVTLTARMAVKGNKIIVTEIPYNSSTKRIITAIDNAVKEKFIPEVTKVQDETGLNAFGITIELKKGADVQDVIKRLLRFTPLRTTVSFNTVIIKGEDYEYMGIMKLLKEWIKFRLDTLKRIYEFRRDKSADVVKKLSVWEKVQGHMSELVELITHSKYDEVEDKLMKAFDLTKEEVVYFTDLRVKRLTEDTVAKQLKSLADERVKLAEFARIANSKDARVDIIKAELKEVSEKFGRANRTVIDSPLELKNLLPQKVISTDTVQVVFTKQGFVKKLDTTSAIMSAKPDPDDDFVERFPIRNNDYIMVLTTSGDCHKVFVDDIDNSRGGMKVRLCDMLGLSSPKDIVKVMPAKDYTGRFTIVYPDGKAQIVSVSKCAGNRKKYKGVFSPVEPGNYWVMESPKFFITLLNRKAKEGDYSSMKAAYVDISTTLEMLNRAVLRLVRIPARDRIIDCVPIEKIPDIDLIDCEKYNNKAYPYSIDAGLIYPELKKADEDTADENESLEEQEENNVETR